MKIGATTTAIEALDVVGNILASGTITASSALINGVHIGSGLSSLETQVDRKQDTITPESSFEALNITSNINLIDNVDTNNFIALSLSFFNDLDITNINFNKQDYLIAGTNITINGNVI